MVRKFLLGGMAGVLTGMLLLSAPALAVPVLWSVEDVVFEDGGTASGTFVFDADTSLYSDIDITTTAGTDLPGASYGTPLDTLDPFLLETFFSDISTDVILQLSFADALTNAGGTTSAEIIEVSFFPTLLARGGTGSVVSIDEVTPVPEPGTLTVFGLGLFALVVARRRRAILSICTKA